MFKSTETYRGFKSVFKDYYPALCFFAQKLISDKAVAEDIVEDVFIKLWEKESDFNNYNNIKALLYTSVKNACLNHIKKVSRDKKRFLDYSQLQATETQSFALLEMVHAEILRDLYAALEKLPVECRNVMHLIFVKGWDNKKVATHLAIHISTVKTHKARGIMALRKKLSFPTLLWLLYFIFS